MKGIDIKILRLITLVLFSSACMAESMVWDILPNKASRVVKNSWVYETGTLSSAGQTVGNYTLQERLLPRKGKTAKKSEFLMVAIFTGEKQQSLVMQGTHDYSTKQYQGSIAAASNDKSPLIGTSIIGDAKTGRITVNDSGLMGETMIQNLPSDELGTSAEKNQVLTMVSRRFGVPSYQLTILNRTEMSAYGIRSFRIKDKLNQKMVDINLYADGLEVPIETMQAILRGAGSYFVGKVNSDLFNNLKNIPNDQKLLLTVQLAMPQSIETEFALATAAKWANSDEWLQKLAIYKTHCKNAQAPLRQLMAKQGWQFDQRFQEVSTSDSLEFCSLVYLELPRGDIDVLAAEEQVLSIYQTSIITTEPLCSGDQCPQFILEK